MKKKVIFQKESTIKEIDRVFNLGNPSQIEALKESLEMMTKLLKTDAEASKAQEEINLYYQNKMENKELAIKPYVIMTMICIRQCIDLIEKGKTIKDISIEEIVEKRLISANVYLNLLAEYLNYNIPSKENY